MIAEGAMFVKDAPPGHYRIVRFAPDDEWGDPLYIESFYKGIFFSDAPNPRAIGRRFVFLNGSNLPAQIILSDTVVAPWTTEEEAYLSLAISMGDDVQELIKELREEL